MLLEESRVWSKGEKPPKGEPYMYSGRVAHSRSLKETVPMFSASSGWRW